MESNNGEFKIRSDFRCSYARAAKRYAFPEIVGGEQSSTVGSTRLGWFEDTPGLPRRWCVRILKALAWGGKAKDNVVTKR